MTALAMRSRVWPAARVTLIGALALFVITIVIGILNGLDIWEPEHDTLLTHVHAGTLGWITLSVSAVALLMFTTDRDLSDAEVAKAKWMSWAMTAAIAAYVGAFWLGDSIPGDRIQRPIVGSILFLVVIWYLVWMIQQNRSAEGSSVVRLGLLLAWVSLLLGAVLGVLLGVFTSQGEIPGLDNETAARLAEAHPPAMVIGFLVLAGFAITEWLIRPGKALREDKWGTAQMWIVFAAGLIINVAFIIDNEDLLGPGNLLEIVAVVILIVRLWKYLIPSGWRGAGSAVYPRLSILFLIADLAVLTYLVSKFISGDIDIDALSEEDLGLVLTLDHLMFIGVMTNALFGVIVATIHGKVLTTVDKVVLWGVNVGLVGFAVGLITVTAALKQIFTPLMGLALLLGIAVYIYEMAKVPDEAPVTVDT